MLMKGRTTLIIAHRLSTISLADRVVLLDGAAIVADGTHAELLATTPLYAEVLAQADDDETGRAVDRVVTGPPRRPDRRQWPGGRLMAWGGGFGPPMGGGGRPGHRWASLPFAGIPHELQEGRRPAGGRGARPRRAHRHLPASAVSRASVDDSPCGAC